MSREFGQVFGSQILLLESLDAFWVPLLGVPLSLPPELKQIHPQDESAWG